MKLSPALSSYLDLLRFMAAATVLFGHMEQDGFDMRWIPLATMSHEAVIVFFVMSGFIIYSSTASRAASLRDYIVSRSSRVYSVALPAVMFSVGASLLVGALFTDPAAVTQQYRPLSLADIAGSLLFTHESWSSFRSGTGLPMNGPYWSLCYEVWYYIIFGLFFFVRNSWRLPLVLVACLLAGPQILALFPIWLAGAWLAARRVEWPRLKPGIAWFVFILTPLIAIGVKVGGVDLALKTYLHDHIPGFWRLEASQRLVTDYFLGAAVLAHLVAFMNLGPAVQGRLVAWRGTLAALAGFSFTMYLFHRPMTILGGALLPASWKAMPASVVIAALLILFCWLMSFVTERRLPAWRRLIGHVLSDRRTKPA
jgi:peptidoglycan/LPS O-acetylase OafA/YrhL